MKLLSRILRAIGKIFIKLSKISSNGSKSIIIKKGTERDLYKTRFNYFFWLKKDSYLDQCIINNGIFEESLTELVKQIIKEGDIVFDVGANIGYYSVLFSRLIGNRGKVFCFEPTKYYGEVLNRNLKANKTSNVKVFNVGLSNKKQKLEIQIGNSSASFHNPVGSPLETKELVNLISLDEFIEEHTPQKIDLIKVDIDGHEPIFFEGAWNTLSKYNPIIILEVSHFHYLEAGYTAWDFYDMLKKNDYKIYHEDKLSEINTMEEFLIKCGNFTFSANIVISKSELKL